LEKRFDGPGKSWKFLSVKVWELLSDIFAVICSDSVIAKAQSDVYIYVYCQCAVFSTRRSCYIPCRHWL